MSNRKKQSVAAAMATVIGVGSLISPVAVHAQDEEPPTAITQETAVNSTQENDSSIQEKEKGDSALLIDTEDKNEIDTMLSSIEKNADDAFTNQGVAEKAIDDALKSYEFSNETTQQDIQDFLNRQFADTGKLKEISIDNYRVSLNATTTKEGSGGFVYFFTLMNDHNIVKYSYGFRIPRLPNEGEVAINSKNFPDPIFRKYVKDNLDKVSDGVLSADEINAITNIDLLKFTDRGNIESLQGIEYFTELMNLDVYGSSASATSLKSLDVSKNTKLETLRCSGNVNLVTLNVKGIDKLKEISCYDTGIIVLDVSENKALTYLNCSKTKIKELDVSQNTALTILSCQGNEELVSLNVSGAAALEYLDCKYTGITALDVRENKALKKLNCIRTKINSLDVSENIALEQLYCSGNLLSWLNIGVKMGLYYDLPTPTIIADVSTDSFNIKDVANGIDPQKIAITSNGSIDSDGVISNYDMNQPIQYEYDCGTAANGQAIKLTVNLELAIDINEANFPDDTFREYVIKNFDKDTNYKLTPNEINNITVINVIGFKDLKSIKGIEYFSALEELYCRETAISSLDVSANKKLESFDCSYTKISKLDVSNNDKLYNFDCRNNSNLTSLNVDGATNLGYFFCSDTGITSLDVSNNKNLVYLEAKIKSLAWLNIGSNSNLSMFHKIDSSIDLKITGNTFNIQDVFQGIDVDKVAIISNGSLDKDKGIVTVNKADQPVVYTYNCGTSKNGEQTINVTLNLNIEKKDSSVTINKDLNKIYDNNPIDNPTVDKTGSSGAVTFIY